MKFRPKNKFGSRDKRNAIILILAIGLPMLYLGGGVYTLYDVAYKATMMGDVYEDDFKNAHYFRMAEMATDYEDYLYNYHLPFNYTVTVYWDLSKPGVWDEVNKDIDITATEIARYGTIGDACIWTGMTLAAECFRYAAAKKEGDTVEQAEALRMVKKVLSGVSLLIGVPSGGIGPEYPALLSRSVRPKEYSGPSFGDGYDSYPESHDQWDIFEGKGEYTDWLYKGYPSTDQHSGIFLGLGQCAKLVGQDDPWVWKRVSDLNAQFAEHLTRNNFMIIDSSAPGYTRTTGQDFKLGLEQSGFWILSILKNAAITNPEKYASLYYHWAVEKNYINFLGRDMRFFQYYNFYSLNINYVMITNLVSLEENPVLRARYEKIINDIYYPIIKNSRNAWFNMGYIYMMRDTNSTISLKFQADIKDQLMRYDVPRGINGTTRLPERCGEINPIPDYNREYSVSDLMNPIQYLLYYSVLSGIGLDSEVLEYARTVDCWDCEDLHWQRTSWEYGSGWSDGVGYARQDSGLAYLLPYYMGRYMRLFPNPNV